MIRRLFCVFLLLLACLQTFAAPPFPRTVRDAYGAPLTLRAAPRRIISLAPGTTEMLFALGLGPFVVGDTVFCDYPAAARKITKIGDMNVNYERVLQLQPDLIVASDANRTAALRLGQLRLPVFLIAPTSFAGTEASLRLVGQATGRERQAEAVVGQMEAKRRTAEKIVRHDPRRPRVLVVVGLNPLWTAGHSTFIDDILKQAGGVNVAGALNGYGPFSEELVLTHPPDFILASPAEQTAMCSDPVFRGLAAVRQQRFFSVTPDTLDRPGPRLADALLQVAHALHPGVK